MHYLEANSEPDKPLKVGIINFDAHFDLRDTTNGPTSGTPFLQMARYAELKGYPFHYLCLGISQSSNTRLLFKRAEELGVLYHTDQHMSLLNLDRLILDLQKYIDSVDHVYLAIDLDALPASVVPGVSAPAARGISLEVVEPLLEVIKTSGKLRLFDVAELNPNYDIDNRSAKVAARIIDLMTRQ
jgi:formiminoglutamase